MTESDAVEGMESPASGRDHSAPRRSGGSADEDGVPALSASIAHLLVTKSALHAWHAHPRLNPNYRQEESAEFDYGRAAHSVLLEGSESSLHVIEALRETQQHLDARPTDTGLDVIRQKNAALLKELGE